MAKKGYLALNKGKSEGNNSTMPHLGRVIGRINLDAEVYRYEDGFFRLREQIEPCLECIRDDGNIDLEALHTPRMVVYVPKAKSESEYALIEAETSGIVHEPSADDPECDCDSRAVDTQRPQCQIKAVSTLAEPLQIAMENGARRALIPIENKRNFLEVSGDIIERVDPVFYSDPQAACAKAMV